MNIVIQRVTSAHIEVNHDTIAQIGSGLVILCGFAKTDTEQTLKTMLAKVLALRVFADAADKMNLNVQEVTGELLIVPQFTLMADLRRGHRPSFSLGAEPKLGRDLFSALQTHAKATYQHVSFGEFGANMQVHLINDGPVTFQITF